MKIKNIYLLISLVGILGLSSCSDDYLEVKPTFSVSTDEQIDSKEKAEALVAGTYDRFSVSSYGAHVLGLSDLRGDDIFLKASGNYGRFVTTYQLSEIPTSYKLNYIWQYAYQVISNANVIINNLEGSTAIENSEAYIAEMKALRAQSYFNLVRIFSKAYTDDATAPGIPISLVIASGTTEAPARGTVQDVYDLIISDLEYAEEKLPASNDNLQRITLPVVKGLLARVYLAQGEWTKARDYATTAYAGIELTATIGELKDFNTPTTEWMWSMDMREDDNNGYLMLPSFYDTRRMGYSSFRATNELVDLFDANDERTTYFGPASAEGFKIEKFIHVSSWDMDQILMRASEMYLIEAEAKAELGDDDGAKTALNMIRNRAGLDNEIATGEALKTSIQTERRRELFGEGFRFFDLKRRNMPLIKTGDSHWVDINLEANDDKFTLPIPQDEIDANDNISEADQNAGY
ncbi:MAG: RagB/SusD family nutrient uptake outer membrane protein [Bacteroidota bacterium]|nr:RagB/SusD family nutrient uptake outer membrane protein [Bacteroidota bacterium]